MFEPYVVEGANLKLSFDELEKTLKRRFEKGCFPTIENAHCSAKGLNHN